MPIEGNDFTRAFVCVECNYPSRLDDACDNPGCLSNPRANHAALRAAKTEYERRAAEEKARKDLRASLRRSGFTTAF